MSPFCYFFSSLGRHSSLSFLFVMCSSPGEPGSPPLNSCYDGWHLVLGSPKQETVLQMEPHECQKVKRIASLELMAIVLLLQLWMQVGSAGRARGWLMYKLCTRNPRYFSTKLLPTQVTPSLYHYCLTDGSIYTTSQIIKITFIYLCTCIYIFLNLKDHLILGLYWP